MNLLSRISRAAILIYLASGAALWIIDLIRRPAPFKATYQALQGVWSQKALLAGGVLLVATLSLIRYGASVSIVKYDEPSGTPGLNRFSPVDDFPAYFVFPEKMLQAGSMGPDPFCARRLESSLGGQSFLDTFVLSMLSAQNLQIVDSGVGLLLIIGLLWGNFKESGTSLAWSLLLVLFFLSMGREGPGLGGGNNITSLYTGTTMFLSLSRTLGWKALAESSFPSRVFIIALIGSAICALKSSFIPASARIVLTGSTHSMRHLAL